MRYEFHSHTFLSDGELHPIEHIRRAHHAGHNAIALTDHVGVHDAERVLSILVKECAAAMEDWKIVALPGVEITHVPPRQIAKAAKAARKAGAKIVVVHGETVNEPVLRGTNAAAVSCADVDVLAHPGFLTEKDARVAMATGVFIELTAKKPHGYTNGHIARILERTQAPFLVNGDVHSEEQLVSEETARTVALGAGLSKAWAEKGLKDFPRALLKRRA
jgi:histidinol phosphatase-like PHP family hydrolase